MMTKRLNLVVAGLLGLAAGTASATVTGFEFVSVDNSGGGASVTGFVTQDLQVTTTDDWTGAAILVELTAGTIYQDSFGNADGTPPNSAFFPAVPSLEFDTYVGILGGSTTIAGGAGDIGGSPTPQFDTTGLNISWANTATTNIGTTSIGRFTLSNDAAGTWTLALISADMANPVVFSGVVADGQLVPEPASLVMLGLGGLLTVTRRRA